MYGIEAIGRGRGDVTEPVVLLVLGVVLGTLALRHLWRSPHPLLDLSVFRIATFRASITGGSLFRAGAGTLVFLLPLLLQVVFGMSAFASGTITFATALGSISMKLTARPILRRFGFRTVIIVNSVISAATIAMCAFFTGATPVPVIFALLLIAGFFQSLQFTATQAMAYADVEQPQMSTATSIASMSQQLSRGFGISFVAALLHLSLAWRGGEHLGLPDFTVAFAGAAIWRCSTFRSAGCCATTPPPKSAAIGRKASFNRTARRDSETALAHYRARSLRSFAAGENPAR